MLRSLLNKLYEIRERIPLQYRVVAVFIVSILTLNMVMWQWLLLNFSLTLLLLAEDE